MRSEQPLPATAHEPSIGAGRGKTWSGPCSTVKSSCCGTEMGGRGPDAAGAMNFAQPAGSRGAACFRRGPPGSLVFAFLRCLRAEGGRVSSPSAKHIILLHQFGGPSHLDTFDMKPDAPQGIRGEFKPIGTVLPSVSVTEHLPRFATVIDRFAQIRSVNHRMKNHNSATYYSLTGHAPPLDDIRLRDTQRAVPGLRQHSRQTEASRGSGGPDLRLLPARAARRQRHARPACQLSGQGLRPVLRLRGSKPARFPAPGAKLAVVADSPASGRPP